jgi:ribonuclease HI
MGTDDPNVDHSLTGLRSREDSACPLDGKEEGHRVEQVGERVSATAICDGRGNAGTGARAAVLYVGDGPRRDRYERAEKLPATTNIVAEHLAIQLAMELAKEHGVTDLVICNDSRSPVNHVNGNYKVKAQHLTAIVEKTWAMRAEFSSFEIRWTSRENTKEADALCRAVDARAPRPAAENDQR